MPTYVTTDGRSVAAYQLQDEKLVGPLGTHQVYALDLNGLTPETLLAQQFTSSKWTVAATELEAGTYHRRMWRGTTDEVATLPPLPFTPDHDSLFLSLQQTEILMADLERVFTVVDPCREQMNTFGSEIRNVLILACTEVEAQWRAVLETNGVQKKHFNRHDYVQLVAPLKLNAYAYRLGRFPRYPAIRPFETWSSKSSTSSLEWYDAYNSVKHDREKAFSKATLAHAISAVAAADIMLVAQFGLTALGRLQAKSSFAVEKVPHWDVVQRYYPPRPQRVWEPVPYDFGRNGVGFS